MKKTIGLLCILSLLLGFFNPACAEAPDARSGLYAMGLQLADGGQYAEAEASFEAAGDYEDSERKAYLLRALNSMDEVISCGGGVYLFRNEDLWGFISVRDNVSESARWPFLDTFDASGYARIHDGLGYGLISTRGEITIPCEWDNMSRIRDGLTAVCRGEQFGLLDTAGQTVIPCIYRTLGPCHLTGTGTVCEVPEADGLFRAQKEYQWALMDRAGEVHGKWWDAIGSWSCGRAAVREGRLWGYIDEEGTTVAEPAYDEVHDYSEDRAAVRQGEYWGYLDHSGRPLTEFLYDRANDYRGGQADVLMALEGWQVLGADGVKQYFISLDFDAAEVAFTAGRYQEAALAFEAVEDDVRAPRRALQSWYRFAEECLENGRYDEADNAFAKASGWLDAEGRHGEGTARRAADLLAAEPLTAGLCREADETFAKAAEMGYEPAAGRIGEAWYRLTLQQLEEGDAEGAAESFSAAAAFVRGIPASDEAGRYEAARTAEVLNEMALAWETYTALGTYLDSPERAAAVTNEGMYQKAFLLAEEGAFAEARELWQELGPYRDSERKAYILGTMDFTDEVKNLDKCRAAFRWHGAWGLFNLRENSVTAARWSSVDTYDRNGRIRIRDGAYVGLANEIGQIVAEPVWESIGDFSDLGLAVVKAGKGFGYMNTDGQVIVEPRWASVGEPEEGGHVRVTARDGLIGYVDLGNRVVLQPEWRFLGDWVPGNAMKAQNTEGLWGYVKMTGELPVPAVYQTVSDPDRSGRIAAQLPDGKWGMLRQDGTELLPFIYSAVSEYRGGYAVTAKSTEGGTVLLGLADEAGAETIPCSYTLLGDSTVRHEKGKVICELSVPSADALFWARNTDREWVLLSVAGHQFGGSWKSVGDTAEGMTAVQGDSGWGFIDESGETRVAPVWTDVAPFSEGLAAVRRGSLWGFVNTRGETVIDPAFSSVTSFRDGVADVLMADAGWNRIAADGSRIYFLSPQFAEAEARMAGGDYAAAEALFSEMAGDPVAALRAREAKYLQALADLEAGRWEEAYEAFLYLDAYRDAPVYRQDLSRRKAEALETAWRADMGSVEALNAAEEAWKQAGDEEQAAQLRRDYAAFLEAAWRADMGSGEALSAAEEAWKQAGSEEPIAQLRRDYAAFLEEAWRKNPEDQEALDAALAAWTEQLGFDLSPERTILVPGDTVLFGSCPQTAVGDDRTPIEWTVLDVQDGKALLISRFALDCRPFDETNATAEWETCSLRAWLNNEFVSEAFTASEAADIVAADVDNGREQGNESWHPSDGNRTKDRICLLSYAEALRFFAEDTARLCAATDYAAAQGAAVSNTVKTGGRPTVRWWLRSPGIRKDLTAIVNEDGSLRGFYNLGDGIAVRPVLQVRTMRLGTKADSASDYIAITQEDAEALYHIGTLKRDSGDWEGAAGAFALAGDRQDAPVQYQACQYAMGEAARAAGDTDGAIAAFARAGDYRDAAEQIEACRTDRKEADYLAAEEMLRSGRFEEAAAAFAALDDYRDAAAQAAEAACRRAEALMETGDYDGAYGILSSLTGSERAGNLLSTDGNLLAAAARAKYAVGNRVFFGTYPQTEKDSFSTAIEWIVLAREEDRALLVSSYILDAQPFNGRKQSGNWEKSAIRKWLNGTFLNKAFSTQEQKSILSVVVDNGSSQGYNRWTEKCNDTRDRVFLLSYAEAAAYFTDSSARRCAATAYAVKQGVTTSSGYQTEGRKTASWWLRSPGPDSSHKAVIDYAGNAGQGVAATAGIGIRPALWVRIE